MMKREKTHYDLLNGSASAGIGFSAVIILYLLFTTIGSTIVGALGLKTENFYYNVITSIFPILAIAIVIGTFSIKRKENVLKTVNATKFNPLYIIPAILLAIGMLLGLGFLNNLIANTVVSLGGKVYYTDVKMSNFGQFILLVLMLAILPAVFEESLFRGVMLDGVKAMTMPVAICTISLCFSLYHGNIAQLIYQLIYGVGLSFLAYFSKSILPSITAHFINNFFILLLTYLDVNINLNLWYIILVGVILLCLFVLSMTYLYKKEKNSENGQEKERRMPESQPYKKFWVPFGAFACGILVMIIIAGVIS